MRKRNKKDKKIESLLGVASSKGFTGRVKIIKTPVGEAPLSVREKWIGLILPCSPILGYPDNGEREKGALSGKKVTYKKRRAVYKDKVGECNRIGVSVPQEEALSLLGLINPRAEKYWRNNGFPKAPPDDCFGFGKEEIKIISGVKRQTLYKIDEFD